MAEPAPTQAGTQVPAQHGGEFPPFKTETYPAQLFWLAVTFAVLLIVMWRVGVRRIGGVIGERKDRISGDLAAAEQHRAKADEASQAYDAALSAARSRAQTLANESRQVVNAEVDKARAAADAEAADAMAKAEARIAETRKAARQHVVNAAEEAAAAIVARLTGDTVPAADVTDAVRASQS